MGRPNMRLADFHAHAGQHIEMLGGCLPVAFIQVGQGLL